MVQPKNGEPLSVKGALATISKLEGLEPALYYRTEGITFMIWGLATAAIYFTYLGVSRSIDPSLAFIYGFLWLPWVAAGMTATGALWRSVHLSAKTGYSDREGLKHGFTILGIFLGLFFLGFAVLEVFFRTASPLKEPGFATIILGIAALLLGTLPKPDSTGASRRVNIAVGVATLLAALLLAMFSPTSETAAYLVQTTVGASVLGIGWFAGGLYVMTKG